MVSIFVLFT